MKRRVVISGMGVVSPFGNTLSEMWDNITNKFFGIDTIPLFYTTDYKVTLAVEVKCLNVKDYFKKITWVALFIYV